MSLITSIADLETLYGTPSEASDIKVSDRLTSHYKSLIEASPFVALATSGPEGLDCSPRGDPNQVMVVQDNKTLLMPDRHGNNRIDSLRNIVRNGEIALMFLIPGSNTTLRVNGTAVVSVDPELLNAHTVAEKSPRSMIIVTIREIYFQCARAIMRSGLWEPDKFVAKDDLPTTGQIMQELKESFDGATYDAEWPARAKETMW
ncbi:MAG: pyridoxamine 5'-phosphate oxidase family protein [Hyphomicrobiales bacterium]